LAAIEVDFILPVYFKNPDLGISASVDLLQCPKVPFFFKQWGGVQKKRAGRILEGRTWDEMPVRMDLVKA
jgi:hypothetical protein